MNTMLPIIGLSGYYVQGFEVIGRYGRPLKPQRRNILYLQTGGKPFRAELHKLIWCAQHRVNVYDVPKGYSFREVNGTIIVETFAERMSNTRKVYLKIAKVKREDYDFIERFASTAKAMIDGEPDAKARLFSLLNSKRQECVRYARNASGGVSQEKAEYYTDVAIMKVFETILAGTYAVASPIASIKWHINHAIRTGRKKRTLYDGKKIYDANNQCKT